MHEFLNGSLPIHAIVMCTLMNLALVLSIAALIKYLVKGGSGCNCGYSCCNKKQGACGAEGDCCK
jgi:hypothetical protein